MNRSDFLLRTAPAAAAPALPAPILVLKSGPDMQLGRHVRDNATAAVCLQCTGLRAGTFICVIPRLRYPPYDRMKEGTTPTPHDQAKDAISARTTEKRMTGAGRETLARCA